MKLIPKENRRTEIQMLSTADVAARLPSGGPIAQVAQLNHLYVQALDDGRYDDWAAMFTENGRYLIHPRENREMGLEGYWIYCDSRRMLEDRVLSLKEVNLYNIHYDRHFLSNITIDDEVDGIYVVRSNYMVAQTDTAGRTTIFSVGEYRDKITFDGAVPRFAEKIVIPDTFTINTLLATPL